MSFRRHKRGRAHGDPHLAAGPLHPTYVPLDRRAKLRHILAAILMAVLVLPLLFWLSWPLGFIFKANPIILAGLVALIGVVILGALWVWRVASTRQVFRRALLTVSVVAVLLPLNGLPFLFSEVGLARRAVTNPNVPASTTGVAMALMMTLEDAVAGIVIAAVALGVRWALRAKGERGRSRRQRHEAGTKGSLP
jgi:hypothetical protein